MPLQCTQDTDKSLLLPVPRRQIVTNETRLAHIQRKKWARMQSKNAKNTERLKSVNITLLKI